MKKLIGILVIIGGLLSLFLVSSKSGLGGGASVGGSTTSCTIVNANQLVPDSEIRLYNKEVPIEYTLSGSLKKVTKR